ncbi:MAG: diacylglycerol/lipid kinase family protein [Chitinophagaceae bacterium]
MATLNRKFAFLINPVSGVGSKAKTLQIVESLTRSAQITFETLHTNPEGHYPELEKKILEKKITDIIVLGGDGSISQVTKALRHTGVNFGIIPMGSGNGLALAAGIPRDPKAAMEIIFKGYSSPVDAFYINDYFSCMLSGIGFDAKVAHAFAKSKRRGLFTYIKVAARNFFSAKPYPFHITCTGNDFKTEAFFISIANSNQFGNQFTIAPKAILNDGLIDVVIVQKMNKFQLMLAMLHQLRFGDVQEKIFRKKSILYFQAPCLKIKNPTLAPLHIDGDPAITADQFSIQIIPSAFRLLQPAP